MRNYMASTNWFNLSLVEDQLIIFQLLIYVADIYFQFLFITVLNSTRTFLYST